MWIESGLAWVPFMMQRLDSEYFMRSSEAPLLKRPPSEYIREMFFTCQPMESRDQKLLRSTFEAIDAETQLLYASDWPHWDFDSPSVIWDPPLPRRNGQEEHSGRQRQPAVQPGPADRRPRRRGVARPSYRTNRRPHVATGQTATGAPEPGL